MHEHYLHSCILDEDEDDILECGGGERRKGREKGAREGCWKRAELGVHRWSALGPLLGSGPIPADPRMPFTSRGPPVVVFLVLVDDAVILAILSSSSLRERERERGGSSIESFTAARRAVVGRAVDCSRPRETMDNGDINLRN